MGDRPLHLNLVDKTAIVVPDEGGAWSSTITPRDRGILHKVLRKVHLSHYPQHMLTAAECDKLLDAWGPHVSESLVRRAIDAGIR